MFFGFTSRFQELIKDLDSNIKVLIIRMGRVPHIDQSGIYAMEEAISDLQKKGVVVLLTGVKPQPLDMMKKIGIVPDLVPDIHVFDQFKNCETWLKENLETGDENMTKIVEELNRVKKAKVAYRR